MIQIKYSDHLAHHGVKGMKWGVRRYQNYDGTRIGTGSGNKKQSTAIKNFKSNMRLLTDPNWKNNTIPLKEQKIFGGKGRTVGELKVDVSTKRKNDVKRAAEREEELIDKRNKAVEKYWTEIEKLGEYDGPEGPNSKKAYKIAGNKELHEEHEQSVKDLVKAYDKLKVEDLDEEMLDIGAKYYHYLTTYDKTWYGSIKVDKNGRQKMKYRNPNVDYDISWKKNGERVVKTRIKRR